jgi:hypothetical protein
MTTKEAAPATPSQGLSVEDVIQIVLNCGCVAKNKQDKKRKRTHTKKIGR